MFRTDTDIIPSIGIGIIAVDITYFTIAQEQVAQMAISIIKCLVKTSSVPVVT